MSVLSLTKAFGLASLVLVLNLAITTVAIVFYGQVFNPGHPNSFYEQRAPEIAAWSAPLGGFLLFLVAGFITARRDSQAQAVRFILVAWAIYVVLDIAVGLLAAGGSDMFSIRLAASLGLALAGALLGAKLGARPRARGV